MRPPAVSLAASWLVRFALSQASLLSTFLVTVAACGCGFHAAFKEVSMTWHSVSRRHLPRLAGVVVLAAVLVFGGRAAAGHLHAASGATPPKTPASPYSILFSAVAISPKEAWAVGRYRNTTLQAYQTLVERWNGRKWSVVASPDAGQVDDELLAVTQVPNTSELWAVGFSSGAAQALIEHWNGKKWSMVPSPTLANGGLELQGVTALSAANVWAVGEANINGSAQTLIEHWDGTSWSIVASPNTTNNINELRAVAGVSATNHLWAVGDYYSSTAEQTLIEYYDGATWSIASSANDPTSYNQLNGVEALADNDVWAVGYVSGAGYGLAEHWDGVSWTLASQPTTASPTLSGVAVEPGTNHLWAVGVQNSLTAQTLVEQWDGSSWSVVTSPSPTVAWFSGVAADSATDAWAVGTDGTNPLIEGWNGTIWTIVSSPAPS
jgi:hypothetical protein